jgi:hypothetical protein
MVKYSIVAIFALCSLGCGARVATEASDQRFDADSATDGAARPDTASDATPTDPNCVLANGTPLCGHTCGRTCASGFGCLPFSAGDRSTLTDFGVCVEDLPRVGTSPAPCSVCRDGELCANATSVAGNLVCVPAALCDRLTAEGSGAGCWYSDKSVWASAAAIPAPPCPSNGKLLGMCGGACGSCSDGLACTGRSPLHPFGVCAAQTSARGGANRCGGTRRCGADEACLSFRVDANQAAADSFGLCVPRARCVQLRDALPGGMYCRDSGGASI